MCEFDLPGPHPGNFSAVLRTDGPHHISTAVSAFIIGSQLFYELFMQAAFCLSSPQRSREVSTLLNKTVSNREARYCIESDVALMARQ